MRSKTGIIITGCFCVFLGIISSGSALLDEILPIELLTGGGTSIADKIKDIHYYLYTRQNPTIPDKLFIDDINSLENSNFKQGARLIMVTHGYISNGNLSTQFIFPLKDAYLDTFQDMNIILVDWSQLSKGPFYGVAVGNVPIVGQQNAKMIEFLVTEKAASLNNTHLIGHSLGAHVAGVTGYHVNQLLHNKVARITGLDPAKIKYTTANLKLRIDASDGNFVDIIHTAGYTFGFFEPLGHADFYPNGGLSQPGCNGLNYINCDHARAHQYYIESITTPLAFPGCKCDRNAVKDVFPLRFRQEQCNCDFKDRKTIGIMGEYAYTSTQGIYYLETASATPYTKQVRDSWDTEMSKSRQYPVPGEESYLSVPGQVPLLGITMGNLIDICAQRFGDREALVVSTPVEIRKTYSQVKMEADDLAAGLLSLGLKKGDRLGIWGPNSYEWYITSAAAMKAGLIVVNINPAFQTSEIRYCLQKVGIKCMMIAEQFKSSDYYAMMVSTIPEITKSPGTLTSCNLEFPEFNTLISFESVPPKGAYSLNEVLLRGRNNISYQIRLQEVEKLVQFDDVCNIQFTSGTTGKSKGVMLSHHSIINNGYFCGLRYGYTETDRICVPVPLFHCFGSVQGVIACMHSGATCILPSPGFNPKAILDSIEKEKCTMVYGTPTMHIDILNVPEFDNYDVSSLRLAVTGASVYPVELIREMKTKYTVENVVGSYGMTETSPLSFQSLPTDTDQLRAGTVGYPVDHCEVKIINAKGDIVKIGQQGELCVRGYLNMVGYWEDIEKTKETIDHSRWLHTGDLAVLSVSGHGKIVGRIKDVIIRGGENVYPREVEDFLYCHPAIQEVQVFGVPDTRMGEEVGAWVRLKLEQSLTDEELKKYCKGKIAHFKIPRYVVFTGDFPKTTSGKVQKFKMRDATVERLGLTC